MTILKKIESKILGGQALKTTLAKWKAAGEKIVFTNGCFDLIHFGHLSLLCQARDLGSRLLVGLNSADSVKRLKGPGRPIKDEMTRQYQLAALECVDGVVVFEEDTPLELIKLVQPDVLVKGGDWKPSEIVGADVVLKKGGEVHSLPFVEGFSTSKIEEKIKQFR